MVNGDDGRLGVIPECVGVADVRRHVLGSIFVTACQGARQGVDDDQLNFPVLVFDQVNELLELWQVRLGIQQVDRAGTHGQRHVCVAVVVRDCLGSVEIPVTALRG